MASRACASAVVAMGGLLGWVGLGIPVESWANELSQAPEFKAPVSAIAQTQVPEGFTVIHVNAVSGNDSQGNGTQMQPYRTITHALSTAAPNTLILLSRGVYSSASGETFPLRMKPGVTIQGQAGPNTAEVIIQGNGNYLSAAEGIRNIAILGADNAGLANVTISNNHPEGVGVWIETGSPIILENAFYRNGSTGIYIAGSGTPVIRNNYFGENGDAGLVIAGPSSAQVQGNVFENTGTGISIAPNATPQILDNHITRNQDGLVIHAAARPQLQNNQIVRNRRNSIVDYADWAEMPAAEAPQTTIPAPPSLPTAAPAVPAETIPAPPTATAPASGPALDTPPNRELAAVPPPTEGPVPPANPVSIEPPGAIAAPPPSAPQAIAASSLLHPDLAADIQGTTTALTTLEIATIAAVPATAALSEVNLAPLVELAPTAALNSPATGIAATAETTYFAPLPARGETDLPVDIASRRSQPAAIEIPIIPPPVDAVARPTEPSRTPPTTLPGPETVEGVGAIGELPTLPPLVDNRSTADTARIRVPGSNIPMGSGGDLPDLFTTGAGAALPAEGPPPPPSLASSLGLMYKVLVPTADTLTEERIRQVVPDAFRVRLSDRPFMQVGAYPTLEEAQAQVNRLRQQGLQAQVEQIR